ncbi:MAG: aminopeptidase, partial [Promethearchaeota archaeon]
MDPFNEKLANLAVNYSLKVQPGQTVAIQSLSVAEDLILALYQEILKAGGFPTINIGLPGQRELFYRLANDEQLKYIPEPLKIIYNTFDHIISVNASVNTRELEQIDPKKMQIENSNPEKAELLKTFLARIGSKDLHWILVPYPCHALAQDAGF